MPSRLTVVNHVYHQVRGGEPCDVTSRFMRSISSTEVPYSRKLKAPLDKLPRGWVEEVSYIVVRNDSKNKLSIHGFRILPGESFAGAPIDFDSLNIVGDGEFTLWVM